MNTFIQKAKVVFSVVLLTLLNLGTATAAVDLSVSGSANLSVVNSGNPFIYTVNYAASSLFDPSAINATATIVLPQNLQPTDIVTFANSIVYDPSQIASATYNSGTNTVNITYVSPLPSGSSGQFQLYLKYLNGTTPNGYNPSITTSIDATNSSSPAPVVSNTTVVQAQATNNYNLAKSVRAGGGVDDVTIFRVSLANNNSSNGSLFLTNPVIEDTLPVGATFMEAQPFSGTPPSNIPTTYIISGPRTVVRWTWPPATTLPLNYSGTAFVSVKYNDPPFPVGSTISNGVTLNGTIPATPIGIGTTTTTSAGSASFVVAPPTPGISCSGGGISAETAWWLQRHILAGTGCNWFSNGWYNSGNTEIDSTSLTYNIHNAIDFSTIRVPAAYNSFNVAVDANTRVTYTTNLGTYVLGTFNSLSIDAGLTPVNHTPTLGVGEYITSVTFVTKGNGGLKLPIGGYQDFSYCGGARTAAQGTKSGGVIIEGITYIPSNPGDDGTLVTNNSTGNFSYNGTTTAYTGCGGSAEILRPNPVFAYTEKTVRNSTTNLKASDTASYRLHTYLGGNRPANNVIFRDTLDSRLTYVPASSVVTINGIPVVVVPTVVGNAIEWNLGTLANPSDVNIDFKARVAPGTPPGIIWNDFTLSSTNGLLTGKSDSVSLNIISAAAIEARKGQSGNCNGSTDFVYFPNIANTSEGAPVNYKVTIKNLGNVGVVNAAVIDVFPFIGDSRGSQWSATLVAPVTLADPQSTVYYTTTFNPCLNDLNPAINPPGCTNPVWTIAAPVDITTVRAIKIVRSAVINPLVDSIEFQWPMRAPVGTPAGLIMNNTITYQFTRVDNLVELLPATPNLVGMRTNCVSNLGSIGNYAWLDTNRNGLKDEAANLGLNGVKVYLLNSANAIIDSTVTSNDFTGNPGYYKFINLPSGDYRVRFQTSYNQNLLTPTFFHTDSIDNNNDANSLGLSELVNIDVSKFGNAKDNMTIDAGYYPTATIGNYVWNDDNSDGLQNEPANRGINGIKVYLIDGLGNRIDSAVTANDANGNPGYYQFTIINSGNYQVEFPTLLSGERTLTTQNIAAGTNGNSDANAATGKSPVFYMNIIGSGVNKNNPTIDAGYKPNYGSISNYVWTDTNGDGLQNEPTSNGINGIKVYLLDGLGNKIDSTITANNGSNPGYYIFDSLPSGNYFVQFPTMNGSFGLTTNNQTAQTDGNSDANNTTGRSGLVVINALSSGQNKDNATIDAGYLACFKPNAGSDINACGGNTVVLTGTNLTNGNWTAMAGNPIGASLGSTSGGVANVILNNNATGSYKYIYTVVSCTDTMTINVNPKPNAGADVSTLCGGNNVVFNGTPFAGSWSSLVGNPAGATLVDSTVTFANNANGTYQFAYTVNGCPDSVSVVLIPKPNAGADIYIECGSGVTSTTISATPVGGTWAPQSGNPSGAILTPTTPGNATVSFPPAPTTGVWSFVYTAPNGCRDTVRVIVGVTGNPNPAINGGSNPSCANGTLQYCPTIWGWSNYQWYLNGTPIAAPQGTGACINPTISGNYTLAATNSSGCWSNQSAVIPVVINSNPVPTISGSPLNVCSPATVPLTSTAAANYQWYKDGNIISGANAQNYTATTSGNYTLRVDNGGGCFATSNNLSVSISSAPVSMPITFPVDSVCVGQSVSYGHPTGGGTWSSSNPAIATVSGGNVTGVALGTATISYNYGNACGNITVTQIIRVTNGCSVTGGGGGGIETRTLGNVIANRLFGNAVNNRSQAIATPTTGFTKSATVVNGPSDLKLSDLIPASVLGTDRALISSPTDLVNFTNALEVLSVDYKQSSVNKAVAFATRTAGEVYSHTKPICDRLKGAELQQVRTLTINGYNVLAYQIRQRTGEMEYAINLNAGVKVGRSSISVQSNWFTDSYVQDETMFNFQLWAVSYDMVGNMAKDILSKLQQTGTVQSVTNTDLPAAYVSKGNRAGTKVNLTVQNNTTSTTGYFELREKQNEGSVETVRTVPFTVGANKATNVEIPVQDYYEGSMYMYLNNKLTDLLYLSDGTWSVDYNKNNTTINRFEVQNETNPQEQTGEYRLMRNVQVTGTTKDYISVYKTINGGGVEQNLSNYKGIKFTTDATGLGQLKVTIVKKGIQNWADQYSYTLNLEGTNKEYQIGLESFRSAKTPSTPINANDVLAVNFGYNNTRGGNTSATINLSKVRFTTVDVAAQQALQSKQVNVYPNPIQEQKFTASFTSETDETVVLRVVEIATGKTVKLQFVEAKKGKNQVQVQLDKATNNGMYSVQVQGDGGAYETQKVMVNRK